MARRTITYTSIGTAEPTTARQMFKGRPTFFFYTFLQDCLFAIISLQIYLAITSWQFGPKIEQIIHGTIYFKSIPFYGRWIWTRTVCNKFQGAQLRHYIFKTVARFTSVCTRYTLSKHKSSQLKLYILKRYSDSSS